MDCDKLSSYIDYEQDIIVGYLEEKMEENIEAINLRSGPKVMVMLSSQCMSPYLEIHNFLSFDTFSSINDIRSGKHGND